MQAIVVQTFIAAPPATVWAALFAHAELLFFGLPAPSWPEDRQEQPPFHLEAPWHWTPEPTTVTVTLHELGGGARLDLRHQGWEDGKAWEEAIGGHFAGWLHGLAALGLMIETGKDARPSDASLAAAERYFISGELPAGASALWRSLADAEALALWSGGALQGAVLIESLEDRFVRWRLPAGGELVALLRPTPRGTHLALAEFGVTDRTASARWPAAFERLTRFLRAG